MKKQAQNVASKKLTIKNRVPMNAASMSGCGKSTDNQCGINAKSG